MKTLSPRLRAAVLVVILRDKPNAEAAKQLRSLTNPRKAMPREVREEASKALRRYERTNGAEL